MSFILKSCYVLHHCVARRSQNQTCPPSVVKVPILQHLESLRDEELEERREKRRRQLAEEEESKQNERRASGVEQAREQSLQVRRRWLLEQFSNLAGSADVYDWRIYLLFLFFYFLMTPPIFSQGSGMGAINGAETTAGTVVSAAFAVFILHYY